MAVRRLDTEHKQLDSLCQCFVTTLMLSLQTCKLATIVLRCRSTGIMLADPCCMHVLKALPVTNVESHALSDVNMHKAKNCSGVASSMLLYWNSSCT